MSKPPGYEIEVVHEGANIVGESPMWHPIERVLYWVDTRRPALHRLNSDRTVRTWPMPTNIGSYVFRRGGGLVAGLKHGFCTVDQATGAVERILDPEPDPPENRLNDGRCDRRGRYSRVRPSRGPVSPACRYCISPFSAIHFWIICATWSEFLSIICMWPLPVTPSFGSSHQSATPPSARSASV